MSFGITEQTFGGAAKAQTSKFDAVFQKGIAKGDTFFASSGDDGLVGARSRRRTRRPRRPDRRLACLEPVRDRRRRHAAPGRLGLEPDQRHPVQRRRQLQLGVLRRTIAGATSANVVWNESWLPGRDRRRPERHLPAPVLAERRAARRRRPSPRPGRRVERRGERRRARLHHRLPDYSNGVGCHIYGGTSAASPQVAALTALANEARREAGKARSATSTRCSTRTRAGSTTSCPSRRARPERQARRQPRVGLQRRRCRRDPRPGPRLAGRPPATT